MESENLFAVKNINNNFKDGEIHYFEEVHSAYISNFDTAESLKKAKLNLLNQLK